MNRRCRAHAVALGALGVLVYGQFEGTNNLAVVLAAGTLVAAMARTARTFRELRALADTQRQAVTVELTGLANRCLFHQRLKTTLAERATKSRWRCCSSISTASRR